MDRIGNAFLTLKPKKINHQKLKFYKIINDTDIPKLYIKKTHIELSKMILLP